MNSLDALKLKPKSIQTSPTKFMNNINNVFENSDCTINMLRFEESLAQINDKINQFLNCVYVLKQK